MNRGKAMFSGFIVFLGSFLYGLFTRGMNAYAWDTSLSRLLLTVGYAMLFTALLQKFGDRSVKNGLGMGLISILGAALGWFIGLGISQW